MVSPFNGQKQSNNLYSLRMRASREGMHISGAERILPFERLSNGLTQLLNRAMDHGIGNPDEINFTVEQIKDEIVCTDSLPISTILSEGIEDSRKNAAELLSLIGISDIAIRRAFDDISKGASPDRSNMRGAMIIDMYTGERLEPDPYRGIRVSRMDFEEEAEGSLKIEMERIGAKGQRVKEALVLARKVILAGTVAELCWSDNPDYTTGYVASKRYGYVRFPEIKREGDTKGGRSFFMKSSEIDLEDYIEFLEKKPVLISRIRHGFPPCLWEKFLKRNEPPITFPEMSSGLSSIERE